MSQKESACRVCFMVLLIVGIALIAIGIFVIPLLPYFQLDAVLSPEELADDQKKTETLTLLKKAAGNLWLLWSSAGLIVSTISGFGLWMTRDISKNNDPVFPKAAA